MTILTKEELESLLPKVKEFCNYKSSSHDNEFLQTIQACVIDLQNGGVNKVEADDAMIQQAVKLYCRAFVGYNDSSNKFAQAYEFLKYSLELSSDYNGDES